jgi:Protein of unknown function (DUF3168)
MASIGGAIRTVLVNDSITGVSNRIYRDIAPPETAYPYITIFDELGNTPALIGDQVVLARNRLVQVSLWQVRQSENTGIINEVVAALDNATLSADRFVYRVRVSDITRTFNSEDDTILHAVTLNVIQKAQ